MITPEMLAKSGSEHGHQSALFAWSTLPQIKIKYSQLKWLYSIPNGFFSSAGQKGKEKAAGLKNGIPDICLPIKSLVHNGHLYNPRKYYSGLYIELKTPEKKRDNNPLAGTSDEQQEWIAHLRHPDYAVRVAYGWEDARDMLIAYLESR